MMYSRPEGLIAHVTECLAAGTLGFLAHATRELAESGVPQALVFCRRDDTPENVEKLFHPDVQLIEVPAPGKHYLRYLKHLREALQALSVASAGRLTVHLHSSKAGFVGRLAAARVTPRPKVLYSPHGLSFLNSKRPLASAAFHALEWLGARLGATPVGCGASEAALLSRLGRQPARVLENAIEDSFLKLERQPAEMATVVTVGRVCFQKAPETFAAIAARFRIAGYPVQFVWVGGGDADGEALLRAAGVRVTGWVDAAAVQRHLTSAWVYVQTSRWEGMPLSVLQALGAGLPCVVNDAVGNRDAVRHGITGFVVRRLDEGLLCLHRLLTDKPLRQRFSDAARSDAERRFSSESFRQRLLALYGLSDAKPVKALPVLVVASAAQQVPARLRARA